MSENRMLKIFKPRRSVVSEDGENYIMESSIVVLFNKCY
jgi:hypothetical protein